MVLLVPPRILRRVIRQCCGLTGWGVNVPHRKSFVVERQTLLEIVDQEELRLQPGDSLPETVILLPQPDAEELDETPPGILLVRWWRLLFHARVHVALEKRGRQGALTVSTLRCRMRAQRDGS